MNRRFCNAAYLKSHSSVESIEENINSQTSLTHSLSQVNAGLPGPNSGQPSNSGSSYTHQNLKLKQLAESRRSSNSLVNPMIGKSNESVPLRVGGAGKHRSSIQGQSESSSHSTEYLQINKQKTSSGSGKSQ